jgi:glycosyltransferase involved in cell wall biosynthesis
MRIVLVAHQFFPEYGAGTEVLTYHTAKELMKRGHEVRVIAAHPVKGPVPRRRGFDQYTYDGMCVYRFLHSNTYSIDPANPMEAEYNNRLFASQLREWLMGFRPDLVHFYHLQRVSVSGIDVCRQLDIPTVFTVVDFWPFCPTNQLLQSDHSLCEGPDEDAANCIKHLAMISQGNWVGTILNGVPLPIMRVLVRMCRSRLWFEGRYGPMVWAVTRRREHVTGRLQGIDRVLVSTRFMESKIHGLGLERGRVLHFPFGVDVAKDVGVSEKGTHPDLQVGFIGTLYEHKGAHVLVDAIRRLPLGQRVVVKIYGDQKQFPRYMAQLRSMAAGDERVEFCGTFPQSQIAQVLSELDVLVVPSLWYENAPLVVGSAQAVGVPVIATDVGGLNETIVHGLNGLLFERGNAVQLAEMIRKLCEDRKLVKRLSENTTPPPNMMDYVAGLERIYRGLLTNRAPLWAGFVSEGLQPSGCRRD